MLGPMSSSGVPTLSAIATMFAVPPIQLPDSAANAFQDSSGRNAPNSRNETTAPSTMPTEPATTMNSAIGPRRRMLFRSTERMSRISATNSR